MFHERRGALWWLAPIACASFMTAAAGCSVHTDHDVSSPVTGDSAPTGLRLGSESQDATTGWFSFRDPVLAYPVRVAYSMPPHAQNAHVLIVIPGAQRNAADYLADWHEQDLAQNTTVLVPELPRDEFSENTYNLGAVVDEEGNDRDPELWTYNFVERLFDQVVDSTGSSATTYDLFGHSAGAQFVHRYVELGVHPHLGTAIAANAGWYLMPDDDQPFPYGLHGIPPDENDLRDAFDSHLMVLLGADDIDEEGDLLRHDTGSDQQGRTRLDRGLSFFSRARTTADQQGFSFAWSLVVVPGAAHDHSLMAGAAAELVGTQALTR